MTTEADKHKATTLQISGFALMTVAGNAFLNLFEYNFLKYGLIILICYISIAFLCFYAGIMCITRSVEILEER